MNEQQIKQSIDDYINQFDYETTNDKVPTKKGFMQHISITDKDFKGNSNKAYQFDMGLKKIAVFFEQGIYMKDSIKLNKIMAELVNSFGYHF